MHDMKGESALQFHHETIENTLNILKTDMDAGLTEEQAHALLEAHGANRLREKKRKSVFRQFFDQFKDVMIIILLVAAAVSFIVAAVEGNTKEFVEPALILLIVCLNAALGVLQESRAEKALDALKSLSAPHARVIRGGRERVIGAEQLVPGDIIRLEAGDFVPADARLLRSVSLRSEESALTGESVPGEKHADAVVSADAPLGDRNNMVFSGCSITSGTATAVVTATGMDTQMGRIAHLLEGEGEGQTPLQQKLAQLGRLLGVLAIGACAVVFVVGLSNGIPALEIFMTAVSLAVSAIPEGLPAIVTIVLSIGVQRMAGRNAIIRRLPAVETLGSASVICSDKTGTLTQNRMTLVKAYTDGAKQLEDVSDTASDTLKKLLACGALCCDGSVVVDGEKETHIGDPTETAIVLAAHRCGMAKEELNRRSPRIAEIPFDSGRKLMTTVHRIDGKVISITKGAFDVMEKRCTSGSLKTAERMCDAMSKQALRVIAVAYRVLDAVPEQPEAEKLEHDLTFMGLLGMIDPPRPEAGRAVAICRTAGIRPVMITGDHIATASAIAGELGILESGGRAVTGVQLDAMTDEALDKEIENISVYARVSPENKIRIVKAWQRRGHVVAMTGDGVNDAPALKAADIGCAMGVTGTDVAKGAADMTLTDDNFATIVDAVREGRGIYANIRKVVGFLLGTNIGEVVTVFTAMLLWHKTPLLSMQLLLINLVTDSLPAIALGMEPVEKNIMEQRPKARHESLFSGGYGIRIAWQGLLFGVLSLTAFWLGERMTGLLAGGQTLAFMVLALSQVVQAFNMRSERSLFEIGPFANQRLNGAAAVSTLLVLLVLFTPLSAVFEIVRLPGRAYLAGVGLVFAPLLVMECAKVPGMIKRRR